MPKRTDKGAFYPRIRAQCFQLKGITYLIKNQRLDAAPPLDAEDISYGIGEILEQINEEIIQITNEMEETELEPHKQTKRK